MNFNKVICLSTIFSLVTVISNAQNNNLQPIKNADHLPTRTSELSENDLKRWSHLDILRDTVPGMSVDRAYAEIIKNKIGKKVIVAVIDSGVEIEHEDLKPQIYINQKESLDGKDNDNNGKVDDIHGWNFLGKSSKENLELTRIVKRGDKNSVNYKRAKAELEKELKELEPLQEQLAFLDKPNSILTAYFKKEDYTIEDLNLITLAERDFIQKAKVFMFSFFTSGYDLSYIKGLKDHVLAKQEANLNVNFDGREIVGDDPYNINDINYGDNNVMGNREYAKHGTHVAGIIAQTRNNGLGGDGIASEVAEIMVLRAVPKGDEYDKDIALAIRYAVDNGAKVINGSFGKYYSQYPEWVKDAIIYAASKDVLIVAAAGNESTDLNPKSGKEIERYPTDRDLDSKTEFANNFLVVGALNPSFGKDMIAKFSNYGSKDVDVFAPGVKIYATVPFGKYEYLQGTSMASPNVAGVAALIRSYYPNLTATQVKKIIMDSGVAVNQKVIIPGEDKKTKKFEELSVSGKFVNAYNALLLADEVSRNNK